MKTYIDTETQKVYQYELDGSQDHLIGSKIPYTIPKPTVEELAAIAKAESDSLVKEQIATMTVKLPDTTSEVIHPETLEVLDTDGVTVLTAYEASWIETVIDAVGKEFDAHLEARINMMNAVMSSEHAGILETHWRLADNSIELVTVEELKVASFLALQKFGELKSIV